MSLFGRGVGWRGVGPNMRAEEVSEVTCKLSSALLTRKQEMFICDQLTSCRTLRYTERTEMADRTCCLGTGRVDA